MQSKNQSPILTSLPSCVLQYEKVKSILSKHYECDESKTYHKNGFRYWGGCTAGCTDAESCEEKQNMLKLRQRILWREIKETKYKCPNPKCEMGIHFAPADLPPTGHYLKCSMCEGKGWVSPASA